MGGCKGGLPPLLEIFLESRRIVQVRIFTIAFSARLGGFDDEPLRIFLADKQVHSLETWHFVLEGVPYWSVLACYSIRPEESAPVAATQSQKGLENWRKLLSDADWPLFNALREWRKSKAKEEGIPPYLVFTNEQLTRLVVDRVGSLSALGQISGVGPSRVEKYGKDVLGILDEWRGGQQGKCAGTAGVDGVDGIPRLAAADDGEVPEEGAADAVEPDRQSGAGRGDDADGSAVHENTGEADPGG
jgi:hypothetical protein